MDDSLRLLAEAEADLAEFGLSSPAGSKLSAPSGSSAGFKPTAKEAPEPSGLQRRSSAVISRRSKAKAAEPMQDTDVSDVITSGVANSRSEAMLLYNAVAKAEAGERMPPERMDNFWVSSATCQSFF